MYFFCPLKAVHFEENMWRKGKKKNPKLKKLPQLYADYQQCNLTTQLELIPIRIDVNHKLIEDQISL